MVSTNACSDELSFQRMCQNNQIYIYMDSYIYIFRFHSSIYYNHGLIKEADGWKEIESS